ncbi:TetR/AcrR family transcriptional regulator [Paramicrobacterium agarici]|uniref:TetR/AcrR family transcriptional regulator n=1 Tax=Paramicrobacterium agarici TaxID=630514 RepID=UPI001151E431|nr:TetR/AcrR family transcriptional regulator [Microbacterium agarici]TQO23344.1 TetR family transcriptional regulator [Microbacterium agarici]
MSVSRESEKAKRILECARDVFIANGFVGTSTDQLAAAASVSKQTIYKEFGDKEGVFSALIRYACDRVDDPFEPMTAAMRRVATADEGIERLAEQFTVSIMSPHVQQLRRLVIAEASRFPHLGQLYWENGFLRVLASISRCLSVLDERGLLSVPDPSLAAQHFSGMLLWIPSNREMFAAGTAVVDDDEVARDIAAGCETFLRAYRR